MADELLQVQDLHTCISTARGTSRPVDGVSFTIKKGETHAIVGESGCGKSMTALSIMQLLPEPGGYIKSGKVLFEGKDLLDLTWTEMGGLRGEEISMIFQEPMTSLNPTLSIGNQIRETMIVHGKSKSKAQEVALDLLQRIGFDDPAQALRQYPHELSGGMRQRVMIAMALANKPKLLIADEPTTALDVTVQAQILRLLHDLQQELGMAVLLITHDLGVVAEVADSVSVMYAGKIVEESSVADLFASPHHPYAQDLLASLPSRQRRGQDLATIGGVVPDSTNWPPGCRYTERCRCRFEPCPNIEPKNTAVERSRVLCHLYDPELAPKPTVEATSK